MKWYLQNSFGRLSFALWNPAFREFSSEVRAPLAQVLRGVGFLKKNPS